MIQQIDWEQFSPKENAHMYAEVKVRLAKMVSNALFQ